MLVVTAIIGILAALLLPALSKGKGRAALVLCGNNLSQSGIAFHIFSQDHNDKFPMEISTNEGGTLEFIGHGSSLNIQGDFVFRHFQVLSNELTTPQTLVCPADTRLPAESFAALKNENVSYFIGANAKFGKPESILSGDRNIAGGFPLRWTQEMHQFKGNVLFADGHVEEWNNSMLGSVANLTNAGFILPPDNSGANSSSGISGDGLLGSPNTATLPASSTLGKSFNPSHGVSSVGNARVGEISAARSKTQNLSDTNKLISTETNAQSSGINASDDNEDLAMSPFDRHVVKFLRSVIGWSYFLLLLLFLLFFIYKLWEWSRLKEQKQNRNNNSGF
jgi:prepilin-type processing-associated H-X9-DG protein